MSTTLVIVGASIGVGAAFAGLVVWRRRRRAALVQRLAALLRDLGHIIGRETGASTFEGLEAGQIVLTIDGERVTIELSRALECHAEPDPERRRQRLKWLVDQARIRRESGLTDRSG